MNLGAHMALHLRGGVARWRWTVYDGYGVILARGESLDEDEASAALDAALEAAAVKACSGCPSCE